MFALQYGQTAPIGDSSGAEGSVTSLMDDACNRREISPRALDVWYVEVVMELWINSE